MATLESLQAKIRKLEQQAEALIEKESSGAIEKIRGLMKKHGLTSADIDAHSGGAQRAKTASADPAHPRRFIIYLSGNWAIRH